MLATMDCIRAMGGACRLGGRRPVSPAPAALFGPMGRIPAVRAAAPCASASPQRCCPADAPCSPAPRLMERGVGIYEELLGPRGITVEKTPESVTFSGAADGGELHAAGRRQQPVRHRLAAGAAAAAGGQYAPRSAAGGEPALHRHHAGHHGVLRCHRDGAGTKFLLYPRRASGTGAAARRWRATGPMPPSCWRWAAASASAVCVRTACRATACAGDAAPSGAPGRGAGSVRLPRSGAGAVCRCGPALRGRVHRHTPPPAYQGE